MARNTELYAQVVEIANDYFGPAAQRFVDRILNNHLHKAPVDIAPQDIEQIVRWVGLALAFITEDRQAIEDFTNRLLQLRKSYGK